MENPEKFDLTVDPKDVENDETKPKDVDTKPEDVENDETKPEDVENDETKPKDKPKNPLISIVIGYYANFDHLVDQVKVWSTYPPAILDQFEFVIVDDGTPPTKSRSLKDLCEENAELLSKVSLRTYRIPKDVGWNNHGARNVGAFVARGKFLIMLDMDCVILPKMLHQIIASMKTLRVKEALYFSRVRVEKVKGQWLVKNLLPKSPNMFLIHRSTFWSINGYNEDLEGVYGTDAEFKRRLDGHGIRRTYPSSVIIGINLSFASRVRKNVPRRLPRHSHESENPLRNAWVHLWSSPSVGPIEFDGVSFLREVEWSANTFLLPKLPCVTHLRPHLLAYTPIAPAKKEPRVEETKPKQRKSKGLSALALEEQRMELMRVGDGEETKVKMKPLMETLDEDAQDDCAKDGVKDGAKDDKPPKKNRKELYMLLKRLISS